MKIDKLTNIKSLNEPLGWMGHLPFAKFIIETLRPSVFVELGTHTGNSYFAFCQSAAECGLECSFYAVDTWKGDSHAEFYDDSVFEMVQVHNAAHYAGFSTLKRMTFDQALNDFPDAGPNAGIDLLHIDGFHSYEAVSHDFYTWVPKVKPDGVVLFHDICEKSRDFGVWRFWEELKQKYPSMEFHHSHGLGVLFMSEGTREKVALAVDSLVKNNQQSAGFFELASMMIAEKHNSQKKSDQIDALALETKKLNLEIQKLILENQSLSETITSLSTRLDQKILEAETYSNNYLAVIRSTSWKITAPLRSVIHRLKFVRLFLSTGIGIIRERGLMSICLNVVKGLRQSGLKGFIRTLNLRINGADNKIEDEYQKWIKNYDDFSKDRKTAIQAACQDLEKRPLISVLVPCYNPEIDFFCKAIDSVMGQVYENWELCIADDCSTSPKVRETLEAYIKKDQRIKVVFREKNGHISECSNSALELARGEYTALLDHDDVLHPEALFWVARQINDTPDAGLIYTDEDKLDETGIRNTPHFKPDFNYELFLSQNYICHLGVYKTSVIKELQGFRKGFEGAQDWDLALRVMEACGPAKIHHIPRILYHWRISKHSTANGIQAKPYAEKAQLNSLMDHLDRSGSYTSRPSIEKTHFGFKVNFLVPALRPLISIIIPTKNKCSLLENCINSILEKTTYNRYEILIIDNGSDEDRTLDYLAALTASHANIVVLRDEREFNFSALNNMAVRSAKGEYLLFLNNDITIITSQWLEEMVSLACRPGVGAVGAKLFYPDDTVQHAGVILGIGGVAGHIFKGLHKSDPGYFNRAFLRQELSCVTAACLLVKKEVFRHVGGFDEKNLAVAFNDVDLCLKIRQKGYRNIWTPYAEFYHHESASRGYEDNPEKQARFSKEVIFMMEKWKDGLTCDPFFNPNLSLEVENYVLAFPPRTPGLKRIQKQETGKEIVPLPDDRKKKILEHLNLDGIGIEIGPSHNPVVPKKEGYHVEIMDHMSREGLIEKYKDHHLNLDNIEPVDFIWQKQSYTELTGKKKYYDWIIASHLIEHTPDLIGFLNECDTILKDDAVISLVIPDKRYCFDHFRPLTGISRIIDSHFEKNTIHSAGIMAEYFLNVVSKGDRIAWHEGEGGEYKFIHTLANASDSIDAVKNKKEYIDVHSWCFVPHSFRLIIHDLYHLGLIPFRELSFHPTEGTEFFVSLSRKGEGIKTGRMELIRKIQLELQEFEVFES